MVTIKVRHKLLSSTAPAHQVKVLLLHHVNAGQPARQLLAEEGAHLPLCVLGRKPCSINLSSTQPIQCPTALLVRCMYMYIHVHASCLLVCTHKVSRLAHAYMTSADTQTDRQMQKAICHKPGDHRTQNTVLLAPPPLKIYNKFLSGGVCHGPPRWHTTA